MKQNDHKFVFIIVGLIGVLLIATPALIEMVPHSNTSSFSELYLLGPNHLAENYPYNIAVGHSYTVYVGVTNHMGTSEYYMLYVKLRNETDLSPNSASGAASPIQPLYQYRFSIGNGQSWDNPFNFSINSASASTNKAIINIMAINNDMFVLNKPTAWNSTADVFYYQLVFELWVYNRQSNTFQFNNRFVSLQLNFT